MAPSHLFLSFLFYCFLLASGHIAAAQDSPHHRRRRHHSHRDLKDEAYRPSKLFVFGDSYADTGNVRKSIGTSWKDPYGITFPGKPAGRFSDGRVLTDYFARFLGLKTPIAYAWMKLAHGGKRLRYGMNFAFGGSGVFNTSKLVPNMTIQIDFFESLINQLVYTNQDLESSVVLVSLAGNDYSAYLARVGSDQGITNFIPLVVNQLTVNLKRIQAMGAKKIVVTGLQPLGCLPRFTQLSSFQQCNNTFNAAVTYHNLLLQQSVSKLNNATKDSSIFILDLYDSFITVLEKNGQADQGNSKFGTSLKPCCMGINSQYSCGSVNETGSKMYSLCSDPNSSFFWDTLHPTEAGWRAVYMNLKSSLEQIFKFN